MSFFVSSVCIADNSASCAGYKTLGLCDLDVGSSFFDFMAQNCNATCGECVRKSNIDSCLKRMLFMIVKAKKNHTLQLLRGFSFRNALLYPFVRLLARRSVVGLGLKKFINWNANKKLFHLVGKIYKVSAEYVRQGSSAFQPWL